MKVLPTSQEIANFLEIYRTGTLTKAAIRLGITQPTLTQSLQNLESKVGSTLFHRTKQGLVTTSAGNLFFERANQITEDWNSFHMLLAETTTELQGRFRIGCHASVGGYVLPTFFKNLDHAAPGIEIELVHDLSRKVHEGVVSYAIDLGYVVNPIRHPDLVLRKLGNDEVKVWKRKSIKEVPQILFLNQHLGQVDQLIKRIGPKKFKDWKWVHTESLELTRTLILQGAGIGILPERIAKAESDQLIPYDLSLPTFSDEIFLVYRKEVLKSKAGEVLVKAAFYQI